jgi:hypothetical protein
MRDYKIYIMKRAVIFILILIPVLSAAQLPDAERLNAYKIGFFTKRLNLSSDEAEKFWPVYNDYQTMKLQLQEEKIKLIKTFNQGESGLSDAQISEIGDKLVGIIVKESELAVNFHKKLKTVLPPAKVIRFYQAENQYKVQLLNELQNRQQNRPLQNRPALRGPARNL